MTRELDLIAWVRERVPEAGDDCAVLECAPWGTLLVTTDAVIDGVHASWLRDGPEAFGYKAVARNLSDIAAMGGEPLWAVVAACLPFDVREEQARGVVRGSERAGCRLVGGDTAFGPTPQVVATVLGRAHERGPVLRSGARPGDRIVVSGALGGAVSSGKHLRFTPRLQEARALVEGCDVGAMIDISDGLSTDLHHILGASGVGARISVADLPLATGDLASALHEGEDYELLATVGAGELPAGFTAIGAVTEDEGRAVLVHPGGREEPLRAGGYEHGA